MARLPDSFVNPTLHFAVQAFFSCIKTLVVVIVLVAGTLIASQSAAAPVSVRLLTAKGMEYAVATFKPYRHYFPEPYLIDIETK